MRNRKNKRRIIKSNKKIIVFTCLLVFLILLLFSVIFSLINMTNENIINGIKIEDIDFSNLNKEQAKEKLEEWYKEAILKDITVYYEDLEETINIKELEPQINTNKVIEEALRVGRSGNIIKDNYDIVLTRLFKMEIDITLTYNEEKLDKKIEEISNKLPGAVIQNSYYIEDNQLIIKKGNAGISIQKEEIKENLIKAIKSIENKKILIPIKNEEIEQINIETIYNEIYKEAQDAYITTNPTEIHTHVNGIDFEITIEEAKKMIEEPKEEYIIPLKITIPNKTLEDLGKEAFPDKISEFTTRYDASNKNRSINLGLASEKINGTIILPGETFSYNKVVGERTIAKGYKEAAVYVGGKVVDGIGGGICQLSSTLYNSAIYANLEIISRSNHRFLTSYVTAGRDATISWGTIDFCFKNTRKYPIKIISEVKNGIVTTSIYGIKEEKEYEIDIETKIIEEIPYTTQYIKDSTIEEGKEEIIQYGSNGAKTETYKIIKYNGMVVSKEQISSDTYSSLERIIKKGSKKIQQVEIENSEIEEEMNSEL